MMTLPLTIPSVLDFAVRFHGATEVVSRTVEGPIHRYCYAELARQSRRLANGLAGLGVGMGDLVGTLAWNGHRHLELYYGISGMGAVCHTVNPRLFADQIAYILDHAGDKLLFLDLSFVELVESLADRLPRIGAYVIMTDRAHMPPTSLPNAICYEELLAAQSDDFSWPEFGENQAAVLCYTSGTTGNPKGVLYSHRSTVLHAMAITFPDCFGLSAQDTVLPVVPMFHVNAWGLTYAAPMAGAKLVLPGPNLDGPSLTRLIEDEGVTVTAGVPTVWLALLAHLQETGRRLPSLKKVVIGGAACPPAMMEAFRDLGVDPLHAWGMTELSPLGTVNRPTRRSGALAEADREAEAVKQGRPVFGIDLKVTGADGGDLPHDGVGFGRLKARGHWVCGSYFRLDGSDTHDGDGWFDTGDVATIDPQGFIQIVDRSKDVIKSGGEWISSIDLENIAMAHPAVSEAAAIARADQRWGERPVLIAVLKPGAAATGEEIRAFYRGKVGKWCEPDEVIIVDSLPHSATGKLQKSELRKLYG